MTGYKVDGYDYIKSAMNNGAVAVMGERATTTEVENYICVPNIRKAMSDVAARFYDFPGKRLKCLGVTGTNGKTTTSYMLKKILEAERKAVGLMTTLTYDTGKEVFEAERTTPESLDMQRLLYLMRTNGRTHAVLEVSSHALVLHRVDNIDFNVVVFTNFTRDHLDFHETMENYFAAKASLLNKLSGPYSYVVLNLDVPEFQPLFGQVEGSYVTYSLSNPKADVYCSEFELRPERTIFDLVTALGTRTIDLQLPGRFNLTNAIAAAAGGLASGVDLDNVVKGLEEMRPIPGRLNPIDFGQPFAVYVDYAHTPDAIVSLCKSVREISKGKLLLLFGCGGDRDRGKRPLMGAAATTSADYVLVTSDNPRNETPAAIIDEIRHGLQGSCHEIEPDRKTAIEKILKMAKPGDAVLLAGKGAEPYQEINSVKYPFSDRETVESLLGKMGFTFHQYVSGER